MLYRSNTERVLCPVSCMATRSGTPRPHEIPHGRARQVVGEASRTPGLATGGLPRLDETLDRLAVAVKHPGVDAPARFDQRLRDLPLLLENVAELGGHREHPTVVVLCGTWIEANFTAREVNLAPLKRQNLARDAPARRSGGVKDPHGRFEASL